MKETIKLTIDAIITGIVAFGSFYLIYLVVAAMC